LVIFILINNYEFVSEVKRIEMKIKLKPSKLVSFFGALVVSSILLNSPSEAVTFHNRVFMDGISGRTEFPHNAGTLRVRVNSDVIDKKSMLAGRFGMPHKFVEVGQTTRIDISHFVAQERDVQLAPEYHKDSYVELCLAADQALATIEKYFDRKLIVHTTKPNKLVVKSFVFGPEVNVPQAFQYITKLGLKPYHTKNVGSFMIRIPLPNIKDDDEIYVYVQQSANGKYELKVAKMFTAPSAAAAPATEKPSNVSGVILPTSNTATGIAKAAPTTFVGAAKDDAKAEK
jgi:hypothetical protein